jgi:glutamate N-acetyltransferase/amino-acid N-acetyltransferase
VVDLEIEGRQVVSGGAAIGLSDEDLGDLERAVDVPEVELALTLPGEGGETEVFFSDQTPEYVRINAEYST